MEKKNLRPYSFSIGNHKIVRGDCSIVLKKIPKQHADVIITSPPYNLGIVYNSYKDNKKEQDYLNWLVNICSEMKRVLKDEGSLFLNIAGSSSYPWLPFELMVRLRKHFFLQNHIEWIKSITVNEQSYGHFKPVVSDRYVHRNHEYLFHLTKTGDVKINRLRVGVPYKDKTNIKRRAHNLDLRCRGDVWFIPYKTVRKKSEKFNHPGTFPQLLPEMCLKLHGVQNPLVIDPFMGTGTTLVATHCYGGKGIGIEVDPHYVKIATERLRSLAL
ncbi:site-specific DNA-methyltransferase [Commensalibacter sp. Nvir]|uniref:DNA-methyltransferase n=1 Tax=Commensalibacter sp. Nvir TaxID=3069817 RepID=UPI0030C7C8E6